MKNLNKIILFALVCYLPNFTLNGMEKKKRLDDLQITKKDLKDLEKAFMELSLNREEKQKILGEIQKSIDPDKYPSSEDFKF